MPTQCSLFEQFDALPPIAILDTVPCVQQTPVAAPAVLELNPALLSFDQFRLRSMLGPGGKIKDQALFHQAFPFAISERGNEYPNGVDPKNRGWDDSIDGGRNYLAGRETPLKEFLRRYTSAMSPWQKLAFTWCSANPSRRLILKSERPKKLEYHIYRRGEYVQLALPHQDAGGEKHWISRDGLRKVLVNQD